MSFPEIYTRLYIALLTLVLITGCTVSKDPQRKEIKQLQKGILKEDTSYVYRLPYNDRPHLLVQGYFSKYSHKNRAALDFKMKKGTQVLAARDGIVIRVKEDSKKGGWSKKYRSQANLIVIQHNDGSRAGYWHLQYNGVLVNVGDTVKQGQVIGLSGRTGYALFPHLHFIAWRSNANRGWTQIGTRFQTSKRIRYLRPFRFYHHVYQTK